MPQPFSSRRARLPALPPRARRFGAAGAILLLTVSTPHASSEALPTSPDVARTPPGMAGLSWRGALMTLRPRASTSPGSCVSTLARRTVWQGQLRGRGLRAQRRWGTLIS